jgi:hypothetical protein
MITTDKEEARKYNLEWLKLSNKVLRAFPNSPRQLELKRQLNLLPKYKTEQKR